jgi:DNA-binding response OmpR family regulator
MFEAGAHAVPAPETTAAAVPAAPRATTTGDDGAPLVVVADAGRPFGAAIGAILARMGCRVRTSEDGTAAFRMAVAERPEVMIVSVHLAGLSGIAICEGVKNSPHLKTIKVAIVGSDLSADLFNRHTALAYGADLFLEEGMAEGTLRAALEGLLRQAAPGADAGADIGSALAGLTGSPGAPAGVGDEIRRLARIMLADLRLYNPERFREALKSGRLFDVFKDELEHGRAIVDHRFPGVTARQDLLATALREGMEHEPAEHGAA